MSGPSSESSASPAEANRGDHPAAPGKRRWWSFRLKSVLIVVSLVALMLAPVALRMRTARVQKQTVAWILKNGGTVTYDWQRGSEDRPKQRPGPEWLRRWLGNDFVQHVSKVEFGESRLGDLSPLCRLKRLETLQLGPVEDLAPLGEMKSLKELAIFDASVTSLEPLYDLRKLNRIQLVSTPVDDLAPLGNLPRLKELDLISTRVSDLTPLFNCPRLRRLYLRLTPVTPDQIDRLKTALPKCDVDW